MAKEIPLTRGYIAIVDTEDYAALLRWKWSYWNGYAIRKMRTEAGAKSYGMHCQILQPPVGYMVDHINGNGLDNRRENLRICEHVQNNMNRPPNQNKRSCPYKGVYLRTGRPKPWSSFIGYEGRRVYLGVFETPEAAALAYNAAAVHYYGEFAWLNQVERGATRGSNPQPSDPQSDAPPLS